MENLEVRDSGWSDGQNVPRVLLAWHAYYCTAGAYDVLYQQGVRVPGMPRVNRGSYTVPNEGAVPPNSSQFGGSENSGAKSKGTPIHHHLLPDIALSHPDIINETGEL